MRKPSKITKPASAKAAPAKPATPAASAKPATPAASAANKPATPAASAANKPAAPAASAANKPAETAKPMRGVTRTVATIAAQRANFGGLSDRDNAYLSFYAGFAKRPASGGVVTIADIAASGARPVYIGSSKPHDAGVIIRLHKAGLIATRDAGASFTFTDAARKLAAYASAPVRA